jgi:EmrB/QacA subfamily drug resistance transporter
MTSRDSHQSPEPGAVTATTGQAAAATAVPTEPPPDVGQPAPGEGASARPHSAWLLAVCCVAQFMVILDLSIVNVALPSIQSSLNFSQADLQWVVDAYAITFAGFLMLGGRFADALGARRTFVAALGLFGLASLAGGIAPTRELLIVARATQGVGGALMAASSLAIITSSFPPGPARLRAIGLWGAMNGLGGAAGTLLGGVITELISWRWVLLINPPIAIATAAIAYAVVSERRGQRRGNFDFAGALTLTIGQMVLVYGVVRAGILGWGAFGALGPIILGLLLLVGFGVIEARIASAPLVPFKDIPRPLAIANGIVVLLSAAIFPMWFVSSLYLQQVLGLSPLHAGLTFLPMALTIMLCASRAGRLVGRFGVRPVLGGGLLMMTGGMLLFTKIAASGSAIVYILIPGMLMATGIGFSIVPSTIAATHSAKEGQAGLASGMVNTSRQIGGGLGIAFLITLATQHTTHLIGANQAVPQALTNGFRLAYLIGAGFAAAAALITFTMVRDPALPGAPASGRGLVAVGVASIIGLFVAVDFAFGGSHGAPLGAYTTRGAQSFVTEPALHPPKVMANQPTVSDKVPPGYVFLSNFYNIAHPPMVGQSGPLILDHQLQPVWFKPVPTNVVAGDLAAQRYHGKPALSWWQGVLTKTGETESGEDVVVDQRYRPLFTLNGQGGWLLTVHEMLIDGDHAWVTANKNIPMNLSKYGGPYNGTLIDSAVQEYDLRTGKLLRSWSAREHIPLDDSYSSLPTNGFPWDAYHVNSIQLLGDGTFVVSMRNTWAAYRVNMATGKVLWTLGGKHSSFKLGRDSQFAWQHNVMVYPNSTVSMFDDHCCQITGGDTYVSPTAPSRALLLKLDQRARTASLITDYNHGSNFDADYMGSAQPLPGGAIAIGWGSQPNFTVFGTSGKTVLDAALPYPDISYRTQLERWVGLPLYPPSTTARTRGGQTTVYTSWNGATQVTAWKVLAGSSTGGLTPVKTVSKSGFETSIQVPAGYRTYKVQALDSSGHVIGTSATFTARS